MRCDRGFFFSEFGNAEDVPEFGIVVRESKEGFGGFFITLVDSVPEGSDLVDPGAAAVGDCKSGVGGQQ
uniref:hypothetical protein n=1 Tax=Chitinophaga silvisoli TaxID=2291814 RepID=UPI003742ACE9